MRQGSGAGFFRLVAALALGAVTFGLAGCGEFFSPVNNNPSPTGTNSYVYVINQAAGTSGTLSEYGVGTATLTALSGSPISLTVPPTSIVVAPNNAFLYVGTGTGIFMYTIGTDGTLTLGNDGTVVYLNQTIPVTTDNPTVVVQSMAMDSTSSWLIVSYQNQTELDAIQIDPTTGIPVSGTPFPIHTSIAAKNPQLALSPANGQLFAALGTGGTNAFVFNNSTSSTTTPWGARTTIGLSAGDVSANAVAVDPTSKYLFVVESTDSSTNTPGKLRVLDTTNLGAADLSDKPTGIGPSAVLADLTGGFVYVANGTDNTISNYTLSAGALTAGTTTPTAASPIVMVEDSSKTYLMAIGNNATPNLWLYSFETSGGALDVDTTKSTVSTTTAIANGMATTH